MSQQQKLEQVLDLLLSEESDQASELLHQIIVEKARSIYESIVDEEESSEVGGEPNTDFTDEISTDEDEIDADEQNDGEADSDSDDEEADVEDDESTEDRVEDLESQLAELRAEFDALMGEELQEPEHADLAAEFDGEFDDSDDTEVEVVDDEFDDSDEVAASMFEKKKAETLKKAPEKKDLKKDKKVDEETQFLNKVKDTGQKGKAGLVGTGKNSPLGAEQDQSPYTRAPSKKDYGGNAKNILGSKESGGEPGKYNGEAASDDTPSDNVNVAPKKSTVKADSTAKFTGGKAAGEGFTKSPLTKNPR